MSLIGKTVNITDKSLLSFFYPNFICKESLFFDTDSSIIYTGKHRPSLLGFLGANTKEYINTTGVCDIDLDVRETLINFVYAKHGKVPKDTTIDILKDQPNTEFQNFIKKYWVGGFSKIDEDPEYSIFDLFLAMNKSGIHAITMYYHLLNIYETSMIHHSIETFLEKVIDITEISVSGHYMRILQEFNSKHRTKLRDLLLKYYSMNGNDQSKITWLLYNF